MRKYLFIILLILLFPFMASGATYHITQSGALAKTGADEANADSVAEFNADNINDGATGMAPGDTIYFHGTITSEIYPPVSGTSGGGHITLDGLDSGDYDALSEGSDGQAVVDRGGGTAYGIRLFHSDLGEGGGRDYINIQDFEITDANTAIYMASGCDHINIKRNYMHDLTRSGVVGTTLTNTSYPRIGQSYVTVGGALADANVVKNAGTDTSGADINFGCSNNLIISYNHLYSDSTSYGIDGIILNRNCHDILVEYNCIHEHNDSSAGEDGMDIKDDNNSGGGNYNLIIRYNHIYDHGRLESGSTTRATITFQDGPHDIYVYCNSFHDNRNGILSGASKGAVVTDDLYIFSNLIYNIQEKALQIYETDDIEIFNNTFAENGYCDNTNDGGCRDGESSNIWGQMNASSSAAGAIIFKNNILYKPRPNSSSYPYRQYYIDTAADGNITSDYNLFYYPSPQTSEVFWGSAGNRTLAQLQGGSGNGLPQEEHSIEENPDLTNIDGNDYTVSAADAGVVDAAENLGDAVIATVTIQGTDYPVYRYEALGPNTVWGSGSTLPVMSTLRRDRIGWDIGAYVYGLCVYDVSPANGATGVSTTTSATWDYPGGVDDADIWLDKDDCDNVDCDGSLVSDDDADKTYDMSTLDVDSKYCLGIKANSGASQGECQEFEFTTTGGPPVDPSNFGDVKHSTAAGDELHSIEAGDRLTQ